MIAALESVKKSGLILDFPEAIESARRRGVLGQAGEVRFDSHGHALGYLEIVAIPAGELSRLRAASCEGFLRRLDDESVTIVTLAGTVEVGEIMNQFES